MTQVIVNGIITAAILTLIGVGFSLHYHVARFLNVTLAAYFTLSAYTTWCWHKKAQLGLELAIPLGIALSTLVAIVVERFLWRPLRQEASLAVRFLASIGTYVVLEGIISLLFGEDIKSLLSPGARVSYEIAGVRITDIQCFNVAIVIAMTLLTGLFLTKTRIGLALRCVACDSELSTASGINVEKVKLWTIMASSALLGVGGVLWACDLDMEPTMGLSPFLLGAVVSLVAGPHGIRGIVVVAVAFGIGLHVCSWTIGAQWAETVVFLGFIGFLMVRPKSFLGAMDKVEGR